MTPAERLAADAQALSVNLPLSVCGKLLDYVALIEKWNRHYNLTAVRDPVEMVTRHILDSLAIVPQIEAASLLDVGSGAGLPGIPVALALPSLAVTLLDASHKRTAFLRQAAIELKLSNVAVACARVENWHPGRKFDLVVSRALDQMGEFVRLAGRHVGDSGTIAAMKSGYPDAEIEALPAEWSLHRVVRLAIPGVAADRCWISVKRRERAA